MAQLRRRKRGQGTGRKQQADTEEPEQGWTIHVRRLYEVKRDAYSYDLSTFIQQREDRRSFYRRRLAEAARQAIITPKQPSSQCNYPAEPKPEQTCRKK